MGYYKRNDYKQRSAAMVGQNISHEGHRQRMRARVEQYGLESLAPHEALEYLLYITNARRCH